VSNLFQLIPISFKFQEQLRQFLCNLTTAEDISLAKELQNSLNWTAVLSKVWYPFPKYIVISKLFKLYLSSWHEAIRKRL